jgi:enoyl-CoA hydratase/carnithine racemase
MTYETIVLEKKDGVGIITLNTPDNLNAMSINLGCDLAKCIEEVNNDDDIKVLVLTGAGRAFCAGAHLPEMAHTADVILKGGTPRDTIFGPNLREEAGSHFMVSYKINRMLKPTIAAVNGPAVGAGFSLALACDIRIASENARFQMAFVKSGVIPDVGGTYYLARLVGIAKACELVFVADAIGAKDALEIGLVNKVVPSQDMMSAAMEMATKMTKNSPLALKMAKQALYQALIEPDMLHHPR